MSNSDPNIYGYPTILGFTYTQEFLNNCCILWISDGILPPPQLASMSPSLPHPFLSTYLPVVTQIMAISLETSLKGLPSNLNMYCRRRNAKEPQGMYFPLHLISILSSQASWENEFSRVASTWYVATVALEFFEQGTYFHWAFKAQAEESSWGSGVWIGI